MAIYDKDGTTAREIGKIYDNDGTTSHQIGKVYDNNGSANSLIYSAEQYLYNKGDQFTSVGGSWTHSGYSYVGGSYNYSYTEYAATYNADHIYLYGAPGLNMAIAGKDSAISLKEWNTLIFEIRIKTTNASDQDGRWGGVYVSTSKNDTSAVKYAYFGNVTTSLVSKTLTLDVSSLTGNYYIFVAGGNGTTVYVDSILLT